MYKVLFVWALGLCRFVVVSFGFVFLDLGMMDSPWLRISLSKVVRVSVCKFDYCVSCVKLFGVSVGLHGGLAPWGISVSSGVPYQELGLPGTPPRERGQLGESEVGRVLCGCLGFV